MQMERDFAGIKAVVFIHLKLANSLRPLAGDLRENVKKQVGT